MMAVSQPISGAFISDDFGASKNRTLLFAKLKASKYESRWEYSVARASIHSMLRVGPVSWTECFELAGVVLLRFQDAEAQESAQETASLVSTSLADYIKEDPDTV